MLEGDLDRILAKKQQSTSVCFMRVHSVPHFSLKLAVYSSAAVVEVDKQ